MDEHWQKSGWAVEIERPEDILTSIARITFLNDRFVWRGAASARWTIQSSLQRAIRASPKYFTGSKDPEHVAAMTENRPLHLNANILRAVELRIIKTAREWGLGFENGTYLNDLQLLAYLQHHGIPTRLLDVTTDPLTALWFACHGGDHAGSDGVLFAFNVSRSAEMPTTPTPAQRLGGLSDPLGWPLTEALAQSRATGAPTLLRPTVRDARMIAQNGHFLLGEVRPVRRHLTGDRRHGDQHPAIEGIHAFHLVPTSSPRSEGILGDPTETVDSEQMLGNDFYALVISASSKPTLNKILQTNYAKSLATLFPDVSGLAVALRDHSYPLAENPPAHNDRLGADLERATMEGVNKMLKWVGR